MPRRVRRHFAIALLCTASISATVAACGAMRGRTDPVEDPSAIVTLNVVNHNALDVTIYSVQRGRRERIGQVTATTTGVFRLRLGQLSAGELQLFADPVGSLRGVTSDIVHLVAGQTVEWTIETDLSRSFLSVKG
jgi:hypothetical protein